jgi:hypothetical protein
MGSLIVVLILMTAGIVLAMVEIFRLLSTPRDLAESLCRAEELSTECYRPMVRLVDGSDIEFLRSQPGFNRKMEARVRRERCQIFRGYLDCLQADFKHVCWAMKALMLQSDVDRPDLAASLVKSQFEFAWAVTLIRMRLVVFSMGIGTVNVSSLVGQFDKMRVELRSLTPATLSSAA